MLIQDDGRASLPGEIASGQQCHVTLEISAPADPGEYVLECDVVHEGISWFADKGSEPWRTRMTVAGSSEAEPFSQESDRTAPDIALSLSDRHCFHRARCPCTASRLKSLRTRSRRMVARWCNASRMSGAAKSGSGIDTSSGRTADRLEADNPRHLRE
jgi:hypothetical protein